MMGNNLVYVRTCTVIIPGTSSLVVGDERVGEVEQPEVHQRRERRRLALLPSLLRRRLLHTLGLLSGRRLCHRL